MDDRDKKISKPGMPPLPPGMIKPNSFPPPPGGRPSLPLPQAPFAPQFAQPAAAPQPAKDSSAEEAKKIQEEKDKLEKKISDMEKLLSQEKEKALLATLKNQQDEALSSRVESSLKDIQEKMRRDRRDHEVEEERLSLKSKIKEMETRLAQERETWMGTLKNQMSERETQGRDVEGHFIHRLQEMERRWLDEKAQWQKEIASREAAISSLKYADVKLRETEDEFRKVSMEKSMLERDLSKMKDEVARAEREKASIESYIKVIPEKERQLAELKSDNIMMRSREAAALGEAKLRDERANFEVEKLQKEIGRLQAEIGSISDRKNAEKNDELKQLQGRFELQLQEKEKAIADVSGEKVRALSELLKLKGFVGRVQAINTVLEKERGQLRLEKMQLAQNMAAQLEEIKRLKAENESFKASHQGELEAMAAKMRAETDRVKSDCVSQIDRVKSGSAAEMDRVKNSYAAEMDRKHAEEIAGLMRAHQEEILKITAAGQAGLAATTAAARQAAEKLVSERQAEFDARTAQLRAKYENSAEEEKNALRRQLETEYSAQIKELRESLSAVQGAAHKLEIENNRLSAVSMDYEGAIDKKAKEYEARVARAEAEAARQESAAAAAAAQKAEAEKYARAVEADRQRLAAEAAAFREQSSVTAAQKTAAEAQAASLAAELRAQAEQLKTESENRARFESEVLFLKQRAQQMEFQVQESAGALETEHAGLLSLQASAAQQREADAARLAEISAELESYKEMEGSLADRLKWAVKGKKE
ncbi:MAG TPA: hypothetical protein DCS63_00645 [Elusimicrobia bacterium]|nr:hypothetical protein [Elusimicrobiota bacterium]